MSDTLDHVAIALVGLAVTAYTGMQRWHPGSADPSRAAGSSSAPAPTPDLSQEYNPPPGPAIPRPPAPTPSVAPTPAPLVVAPPPPPVVPDEPATCRITRGPNFIARSADLGSGLFLHADARRVGLGWVVPPRHSPGPEGVSFAWLNSDGSRGEWVTESRPSRQRDHEQSSSSIAQALPFIVQGEMAPRVDRRYLTADGHWRYECGDVGGVFASMIQPEPDLPAVLTADWNAMFWCRTSDIEQNPFVLAARAVTNSDGTLQGSVMLYPTRAADAPTPATRWTISFDPDSVAHAREPMERLREVGAPSKMSVVETPQGYAVTFIHHGRLHLGWLDLNLNPQGSLRTLQSLGATPGRATLAWNGREVVMVFADRLNAQSTYLLQWVHVPFGQDPPTPTRLPATALEGESEVAPGLTRLHDGSFLLAWTYGPDGAHEGPRQNVYVRRYDASMRPRGGALWLAPSAACAEVIATGDGRSAVAVAMQGNGSTRDVISFALDCDQ